MLIVIALLNLFLKLYIRFICFSFPLVIEMRFRKTRYFFDYRNISYGLMILYKSTCICLHQVGSGGCYMGLALFLYLGKMNLLQAEEVYNVKLMQV